MGRVIECSGNNYQVSSILSMNPPADDQCGLQHGKSASDQIHSGIQVYKDLFRENVGIDWSQARNLARRFVPAIEKHALHLLDEMRGIAEGANVDLEDILALNARSEIALTRMSDGCTAFSRKERDGTQWLAQNWYLIAIHTYRILIEQGTGRLRN